MYCIKFNIHYFFFTFNTRAFSFCHTFKRVKKHATPSTSKKNGKKMIYFSHVREDIKVNIKEKEYLTFSIYDKTACVCVCKTTANPKKSWSNFLLSDVNDKF